MITLDITNIMNEGDLFERAFFNWLNLEKISWCVVGANLNYIGMFLESDIIKTKEYWTELKTE